MSLYDYYYQLLILVPITVTDAFPKLPIIYYVLYISTTVWHPIDS